jgi:hypothetical protein
MEKFEKLIAELIARAHGDGEDETSYDSNETIAARRSLIEWLKNEIGFCVKHGTLHHVMDAWCLKCADDYDEKRAEKINP